MIGRTVNKYLEDEFDDLGPKNFKSIQKSMKIFPTLEDKSANVSKYLIKDYGNTSSWVVLL